MTASMRLDCDVAIVGGGPAGATTACLLARRGISVIVAEAGDYSRQLMGQTLSPSLTPLLDSLRIDLNLGNAAASTCYGIDSAWGGALLRRNEFFWTPYGNGWHVERSHLDQEFARTAIAAGAQVMCNSRVLSCRPVGRHKWLLKIQSGDVTRMIRCKFLVDAAGRSGSAPVSRIDRPDVHDRLIGITWIGETHRSYPYTLIESVSAGWFYSHPVPGSRFTIVMITDSDIYRGHRDNPLQFWRQQLRHAKHIRDAFPECAPSYPQRIFSAATILRSPTRLMSSLAVGDATMSIDPISGQGIHDALLGAVQAATAIDRHLRTGSSLRSYDAWIRRYFHRYLSIRRRFYSIEQRWPASPFWMRRHVQPEAG